MNRPTFRAHRLTRALRSTRLRAQVAIPMLLAITAATGAITAAAALGGAAPVPQGAITGASSDSATASMSVVSNDDPGGKNDTTPTTEATTGATQTENATTTATGDTSPTPGDSTSTAATGTNATESASPSVDPHNDGNGCDDIIHAADRTPAPGGPIGCTVGQSGDHRQNGKTVTPTAAATDATDTATPTETATADATTDHGDPHADGNGCDDVNPAVVDHQPSHGGPVDCTVGNSEDHRQNGKTPTPTADAATPDATGDPSPATSGHRHGPNKGS